MKVLKKLKDLLNRVMIKRTDGSKQFLDLDLFVQNTRPTKRNCFVLDMSAGESIETAFFFFKTMNGSVQILMESSTLSTDRDLSVQSRYRTGHDIGMPLKNANEESGTGWKTYDVMLSENIYVETDPTKGCRNYPTENFPSYNDCDKDFIRKELDNNVAKGFTPFWATDNFDQVSTANVKELPDTAMLLALYDGSKASNCPLPCQTTSMRTVPFSEEYYESPLIQINFADLVPISKTDFMEFSLAEFLSNIGGSLGLWLGLGVLQLLQVVSEAAQKIMRNYVTNKRNQVV